MPEGLTTRGRASRGAHTECAVGGVEPDGAVIVHHGLVILVVGVDHVEGVAADSADDDEGVRALSVLDDAALAQLVEVADLGAAGGEEGLEVVPTTQVLGPAADHPHDAVDERPALSARVSRLLGVLAGGTVLSTDVAQRLVRDCGVVVATGCVGVWCGYNEQATEHAGDEHGPQRRARHSA
jgi:hypothetical protein